VKDMVREICTGLGSEYLQKILPGMKKELTNVFGEGYGNRKYSLQIRWEDKELRLYLCGDGDYIYAGHILKSEEDHKIGMFLRVNQEGGYGKRCLNMMIDIGNNLYLFPDFDFKEDDDDTLLLKDRIDD
jgi:hypothetical protein